MIGVNLSGAEFGSGRGVYGRDYIYPGTDTLAYYAAKGVKLVRLPFGWERIQPQLGGPLDSAELGRLQTFLRHAEAVGIAVVLDRHQFGRYDGVPLGSGAVTPAAFADVWGRLAGALRDHSNISGYGLMNEPHGLADPSIWPTAAQAATDAIRAVDACTTVIVSGDDWSGARVPSLHIEDVARVS